MLFRQFIPVVNIIDQYFLVFRIICHHPLPQGHQVLHSAPCDGRVLQMLGNTPRIALKHYLTVTDDDFKRVTTPQLLYQVG
ncbi:MAG: hypothetical protein CMJ62_10285 [Planctomycetaceae bacterium]|nr:hypothetical protein [Planctomycetaceae bacterium]